MDKTSDQRPGQRAFVQWNGVGADPLNGLCSAPAAIIQGLRERQSRSAAGDKAGAEAVPSSGCIDHLRRITITAPLLGFLINRRTCRTHF